MAQLEHKRSRIARTTNALKLKEQKKIRRLRKEKLKLDTYVKHTLEKRKITRHIENFKITRALKLFKSEIKNLVLDSGVKIRISAKDRSAFIVNEGDLTALPEGRYNYKDKVIIIQPDAIVKAIEPKPKDILGPRINNLRKYVFRTTI